MVGQLRTVRAHAGGFDASVDGRVNLAVRRSVLPVRIRQVGRLRLQGLGHLAVAFTRRAVTADAVLFVKLLAGRDRRGVGGHWILQLGRVHVSMRAARLWVLMFLWTARRDRHREDTANRNRRERAGESAVTHRSKLLGYSIIRGFWSARNRRCRRALLWCKPLKHSEVCITTA